MDHIKGVFFDLHGTLLLSDDIDDAWERWATAFHEAMSEKGAIASFDEFKTMLHNLFEGPEPDFDAPGFTLFMKRVKLMGDQLGVEMGIDELRLLVDSIIKVWHHGMYLDSDSVPVIEELKKRYKVGLVTNWEHTPRIYELLRELEADGLFDCVVVSDGVGYAKPDPRVFKPAFNITEVSAAESVYVGDMDVDIEGALNAGMTPVLIKRPDANGTWDQFSEKPVCSFTDDQYILIQSLTQLKEVLNC